MTFNISDFKSTISALGVAKPSHFAVNISPPQELNSSVVTDLPLVCDSVNLPGIQISPDAIKHRGYGLNEKRPNDVNFDDITVTFIADSKGKIMDFLEEWFGMVVNHSPQDDSPATETFRYPNEYYGTIEIYLYDITSAKYITYTMHQAFPINLAGTQLAWEQTDQIIKFPVTFSFRNYTKKLNDQGSSPSINTSQASLIDSIITQG